jgi:hypothetical protein
MIACWVMAITLVSCCLLYVWAFFIIGWYFLWVVACYMLAGFITGYFYSYKVLTRLHAENDYSKLQLMGIAWLSFILIYLIGAALLALPISIWNILDASHAPQSIWYSLADGAGSSFGVAFVSFIYLGFLGLIIAPVSALKVHRRYKKRAEKANPNTLIRPLGTFSQR